MSKAGIVCATCGAAIDPIASPTLCPICGSQNRLLVARDAQVIKSNEQTTLKKMRPGNKRFHEKIKAGDDFHHKSGQWNRLERIIDRDNNRYFEHIEDDEGNVIRHIEEPLTEHRGHGDAKRVKSQPKC